MSKELIRLRDLCMAFDDELVLDHINLYINDSEFLTLLGPSGCGKTTTLRIIGGFTTPTSGDVTFDGVRINDVPPHKRQINTVFQKYALFPHLDVFENIAFGLRIAKVPADEIEQRVTEMLGVVSLKALSTGGSISSPAASSSVWPLHAHWCSGPPYFCWTSRFRRWTPRSAARCARSSSASSARPG